MQAGGSLCCCCFLKKGAGCGEEEGEETGAGLLKDSMSCAQCIRKVLKTAKAPNQTHTAAKQHSERPPTAERQPSSPRPCTSHPPKINGIPSACAPCQHSMAKVAMLPPRSTRTWTADLTKPSLVCSGVVPTWEPHTSSKEGPSSDPSPPSHLLPPSCTFPGRNVLSLAPSHVLVGHWAWRCCWPAEKTSGVVHR